MLNFDFHNPTHIAFGEGRVADLDRLVPAQARVLILVGGASAEKNGTLAEVRQALGARAHATFSGIEPNPSYETALRAVQQVREGSFDFLLAVGGGSVIDAVKFIAAAVHIEGDPWSILEKRGRNIARAMPFGAVLTLPATGSEMNNGAVITKAETQDKLFFFSPFVQPRFSILDPETTYTLPARQIANGVVDAYVHTLEQYTTYPVQAKVQDRFAEGLLRTLLEEGPAALANPQDYDVRANLMWTATMALNGTLSTGVPTDWATHMIGHELTGLYGLDHAQTLAIVQTAVWKHKLAAKQAKLAQYAERVFDVHDGSEADKAQAAIARTEAFFTAMGNPVRLSAYGLGDEVIDAVAAKLTAHGHTALGEHADITPDDVKQILRLAL